MDDFPLHIHMAYKERQNRAITFFKLILMIPWLVWLVLWTYAFELLLVLAWFILLFTARWPKEFFSFGRSFMRYQTRFNAWIYNLNDSWLPWNGQPNSEWGLTLEIERIERYNRWKTFFRLFLALPLMLLAMGVNYYLFVFWFLGFWSIIFTGRLPRWCYQQLANTYGWTVRYNAYLYLLVESFPPFKGQDDETGGIIAITPAPTPGSPPPQAA